MFSLVLWQGIFMGNPVTYDLLDNVDMFQIYTFLSLIPLRYALSCKLLVCPFFHNVGFTTLLKGSRLN